MIGCAAIPSLSISFFSSMSDARPRSVSGIGVGSALGRSPSAGGGERLLDEEGGSDDELQQEQQQQQPSPSPSPSSDSDASAAAASPAAAAAASGGDAHSPAPQPSPSPSSSSELTPADKQFAAYLMQLPMLKCGWLEKRDPEQLSQWKSHWVVLRGGIFAWHKDSDAARRGVLLGKADLASSTVVAQVLATGGELDLDWKLAARSFGVQQLAPSADGGDGAAAGDLVAFRAKEVKDHDTWVQVLEAQRAKLAAAAAEAAAAAAAAPAAASSAANGNSAVGTANGKGKKKKKNKEENKQLVSRFKNDELCYGCSKNFTTLRRRHHCRLCCHTFCNACSEHKSKIPSLGLVQEKVRVCDECFKQLLLEATAGGSDAAASAMSPSSSPSSNAAPASSSSSPGVPTTHHPLNARERDAADALAARERNRIAEEEAASAALAKHRAFLAEQAGVVDPERVGDDDDDDDGPPVSATAAPAPIGRTANGRGEAVVANRTRATRPPPPKEQQPSYAAHSTTAQPATTTTHPPPTHVFAPNSHSQSRSSPSQSQSPPQSRQPMGKMHIAAGPGGDVGDSYVSLSDHRDFGNTRTTSAGGAHSPLNHEGLDSDDEDAQYDEQGKRIPRRRKKQPWYCCC